MKLTQIRDFIVVAERGGLRRAARHLGLAQPVITRSIRDLENELGAELFERSAIGVTLTPIGESFLRRSHAIQEDIERAREEVAQLRGQMTGRVALGLSTAAHVAMLPRIFEPFRRCYPHVRLDIMEGTFASMEASLRNGALDFYVGPIAERTLPGEFAVEKLFDNKRVVFGRRGHPLQGVRSMKELTGAQWVTTSLTVDMHAELGPLFEKLGLPLPVASVHAHTGLTALIVTASSDLLLILPQQWRTFARESGMLQPFDLEEMLEAPAICVARRSRLPLTPVAEHMCDLFKRAAMNQPPE